MGHTKTEIEITREQVMQALMDEPVRSLRAGYWSSAGRRSTALIENRKECHVCAVGAVLRNAVLDKSTSIALLCAAAEDAVECGGQRDGRDAGSDAELFQDARYNIRNRVDTAEGAMYYWAALSHVFEGLCRLRGIGRCQRAKFSTAKRDRLMADVRAMCVGFVAGAFPAKLIMCIDGATPSGAVVVVVGRT